MIESKVKNKAEDKANHPADDLPADPLKWSHLPSVSLRKMAKKSLGEILVESTSVTSDQIESALKANPGSDAKLGELLVEKNLVSEEEVLKALAFQLDLPYYNRLPINDIDPGLVDNIQIQFCRDNRILPVARDDFNVTVAVADPLNVFPLDDLRLILSTNINMIVCSPSVIENAINRVYERSNDASQKVIDELNVPDINAEEDLDRTRDLLDNSDDEKPIIKLVHGLLSRAVKEKASDIHIEPYEQDIMVRFRVDGSLQDKMEIPRRHASSLASRVKIMGKLNIAEKRVPQDGRISIKVAGKDIDVRLSVLPTAHGERIVMRLLDKSSGAKRLDQVGLDPEIYQQWIQLIEQNHGIILVTGPTGSGKTSLLYASLMHINTTDINILTIEDPVEYQLAGVGQTQVQEKIGMTFAEGLRSILRQDPDVIMIGEIRDGTTAGIAIQSSMTGHLVLSTVHTNDTASTVTRFMDFNIQPFQITSAVIGIIATRLLRKLCTHCREAYVPTDRELHLMELKRSELGDRKIFKNGGGCEKCQGIGYKDRMGIYELLVFNDQIREIITKTQDGKVIKKVAVDQGMVTLRTAAIKKVLAGITSLEEAMQNTQADDFDDVGE
jgi:general secretion pathway protein E